jgi:hypothetical protein
MIIKTISVTYGRKVNLGNYNGAEASLTLWADLQERDNAVDRVRVLQGTAESLLHEQLNRVCGPMPPGLQ